MTGLQASGTSPLATALTGAGRAAADVPSAVTAARRVPGTPGRTDPAPPGLEPRRLQPKGGAAPGPVRRHCPGSTRRAPEPLCKAAGRGLRYPRQRRCGTGRAAAPGAAQRAAARAGQLLRPSLPPSLPPSPPAASRTGAPGRSCRRGPAPRSYLPSSLSSTIVPGAEGGRRRSGSLGRSLSSRRSAATEEARGRSGPGRGAGAAQAGGSGAAAPALPRDASLERGCGGLGSRWAPESWSRADAAAASPPAPPLRLECQFRY